MRISSGLVLSAILWSAAAPAAHAATQSAAGQVSILSPLSALKNADLDFGDLVVSGARSFFVGVGRILDIAANQPNGVYSATFLLIANYR